MFKVLLLQPPIKDYYFTPARMEPLGLFYLHLSLLKIDGLEIKIYDAAGSGKIKPIHRPDCFSYLDEIYAPDTSPMALPQLFKRLGDSYQKVQENIKELAPDLLIISSNFTPYHPDVEDLIQEIKASMEGLIVVTGGWAVESEPHYWAKRTASDYLLYGPSVLEALPAFVKSIKNQTDLLNIPGLIKINPGSNPQYGPAPGKPAALPQEPPPRTGDYSFGHQPSARMILSRGCIYTCQFCAVHRFQSLQVRALKSIEDELKSLARKGIKVVNFEDDHIFYSSSWSKDFLQLLKKFHTEWGMNWTAMNGITAKNLAPFATQAIDAGFTEFNLSMVSGDPSVLNLADRKENRTWIEEIAKKTNGQIRTLVFLIGGLPGSSSEGLLEDIRFLNSLPVTIGYSPLYLLPGVPYLESLGLPQDRRLCRTTALYQFPQPFDRDTVLSFWKLIRALGTIRNPMTDVTEKRHTSQILKDCTALGYWTRRDKSGIWQRSTPLKGFSVKDLPSLGCL